jgi:hypothetical protein
MVRWKHAPIQLHSQEKVSQQVKVKILGPALLMLGTVAAASAQANAAVVLAPVPYQKITPVGRFQWAVDSTIGVPNLAGGLFSAAFGTWRNRPPEYGPHWEGYGKRYGMRLTGGSVSNFLEAGLGAAWGEDPRYFRVGKSRGIGGRIGNAIKYSFVAHGRDGRTMPAYARYTALTASNYLSNTWRAQGEAKASDAATRIGYGFLGKLIGNTFTEFWPDIKAMLRR